MQAVDYGAHISYQISISIILSMPVFNFDGHVLFAAGFGDFITGRRCAAVDLTSGEPLAAIK